MTFKLYAFRSNAWGRFLNYETYAQAHAFSSVSPWLTSIAASCDVVCVQAA